MPMSTILLSGFPRPTGQRAQCHSPRSLWHHGGGSLVKHAINAQRCLRQKVARESHTVFKNQMSLARCTQHVAVGDVYKDSGRVTEHGAGRS